MSFPKRYRVKIDNIVPIPNDDFCFGGGGGSYAQSKEDSSTPFGFRVSSCMSLESEVPKSLPAWASSHPILYMCSMSYCGARWPRCCIALIGVGG